MGVDIIMLGIYFSGTGNSKYVLELFLKNSSSNYEMHSIEDSNILNKIKSNDNIIISYPIYCSALPKIFNDFLSANIKLFTGKKIFLISTMRLFSGDGCGLLERMLKKVNATVLGGLHVKMPSNICDVNIFQKNNLKLIKNSTNSILQSAINFKNGIYKQDGLSKGAHISGFIIQRSYSGHIVKNYSSKLKVDIATCIKCKRCVTACPMKNLILDDTIKQRNKCTLCYRCVNLCPTKSITLLGSKTKFQYKINDYIKNI